MGIILPERLLLGIVLWLMLTLFAGMILAWFWALRQLMARQPLLPDRPLVEGDRTVWGGGTVLLVFVIYLLANLMALEAYTLATRGVAAMKSVARRAVPHRTAAQRSEPGQADQGPARASEDGGHAGSEKSAPGPAHPSSEAETDAGRLSLTEGMFVQTAVSAGLLLLLPLVVRATSRARLRDFGLSFVGWKRQAAVGVVAILIMIPAVYAVQNLIVKLLHVQPETHPVETMLLQQSSRGGIVLGLLAAVLVAPLLEELMFRGILQRWLVKRLAGEHPAPTPVGPDSPTPPPPQPIDVSEPAYWEDWAADQLDLLTPGTLGGPAARPAGNPPEALMGPWEPGAPQNRPSRHSRFPAGVAITLASLVFAAVHLPQWPAPIALFILALAIGTVYDRTGSLIASVCMHAVFNGFSMLGLMILLLGGRPEAAGKAAAPPAMERSAPVGTRPPWPRHVEPSPRRAKREANPFFF